MRIAMLTNNYKPFIGGVPISIERLANGLRALGHEVYIFAPTYENQVEEEYVIRYKSIKYKISGGIVIPNIFDKNIEKIFKELNFDIIHVHHPMLIGQTALYLGKKYNIPVTYTYHTRYEEYLHYIKPYELLENRINEDENIVSQIGEKIIVYSKKKIVPNCIKLFTNKCSTVFAPTDMMKNLLISNGTSSNIKILPTGLDNKYFLHNEVLSEKIRKKYIKNKRYLFCTVSRLTKEKNIEFILSSIKTLKRRIGNCFNMIIIGDGPLKNQLITVVKELDVEENIIFLNSVKNEEINNYYRASDLFLFASKSETQGIVLLEAMAAKVPVVAIKASGVIDVVRNEVNGFMVSEDIECFAEKVEEIINNEELFVKLREGAYREAYKYLNSNIADRAVEGYRYAISEFREGKKSVKYSAS